MVSFSTMSLVDTLFVGRIGPAALAGVGLGSLLAFTIACFSIGLFRGVKVLVAQAAGAGQSAMQYRYLGAALYLALGLGVVSLVVGVFVHHLIPSLVATDSAAATASTYFAIRMWGIPVVLLYSAIKEWRYGLGDTRSPLVATLIANAINIVLDYCFIVGLGWGVAGAAAASVIAQSVEFAVLTQTIRRKHLAEMVRGIAQVGRAWRIGYPNGVQFVVNVGSFTLATLLISGISEVDMAAHQVALQVLHLSFLPAWAVAEAGSILAGRAVGSNRDALVPTVARAALIVGITYTAATTVALLTLTPTLAAAFSDSLRVQATTALLLYYAASFQLVDAAAMVGGGLLRGTGDVRFPAVAGVVAAWLCTPTLCWYLGVHRGWGALGGWVGISLELLLVCVLMWWRFLSKGWLPAAHRSREELAADVAEASAL
jgi:MATE family multidrug resistance protein